MAYQIQYTPEDNNRYPPVKHRRQWKQGRTLLVVALLLGVICLRVYGIPDWLIPGDPQVTKTAAENLLGNIREGDEVQTAIMTFCKEVVDGA